MQLRTKNQYNATCVYFDELGKEAGVELVQYLPGPTGPNGKKQVYRANGHWTHENGTVKYHKVWENGHMSFQTSYKIYEDDGERYFNYFKKND